MQNPADRALKERIIGAIVLVVFVVLVVPVFLDGSADEPDIISESVILPGQNNQERQQQKVVLERNRSQPVPTTQPQSETPSPVAQLAPAPQSAAPQSMPVEQSEELTEEQPEADEQTEPDEQPSTAQAPSAGDVESSTGMWAVQLGSFSNEENAERLAAGLRDQGYAAFLSQLESGGRQLHRVRIGPQKDRASAEKIASQLTRGGHSGQVVPHP